MSTTRRNERARADALAAGRATYQYEVIDAWPACTECGTTIRNYAARSPFRTCGCDGVFWRCTSRGWERAD